MQDLPFTAYGVTSETDDGQHIFMLDVDQEIKSNRLWIDCKNLQDTFNLSDIFVLKSTHGYNIFTFDKMTLEQIYKIGIGINYSDKEYYKIGLERGHYALKINKSKRLMFVISKKGKYQKSQAHLNFFSWFFDMKLQGGKENGFDNNDKIVFVKFQTRKEV